MLSFIIPAYNAEKYIEAAILSCTRQVPEGEYEILVCDDASTDNTAQVVRNLAERIPEIKLYEHDENKGVCHSRNLLMQSMSSATKYVAFLDADDVFRDRAIARCIQKLEAPSTHRHPT